MIAADQAAVNLAVATVCDAGMKRWVGLGVIADNLINIGRAMAKQSVP